VSGRLRAWDKAAADMAVGAIMTNKREHREKLALYSDLSSRAQAQGLRIGTYGAFCNLARRVDASVTTYRDKGVRGLREDIVPAIARDFTAYRAMECLVGDQHKADYYAIDAGGNVVTLELFCWLDFRTQLAWGAIAYKHYNRYTVGQALLNAVAWGLPSTVYTDWGKPEESNYMTQLLDQITGLGIRPEGFRHAQDSGIRHTRAKVRHPQAKPIEAWFGRLDKSLKNAGIPGYCKRLKDTRENELQQKELKELIRAGGLLSVAALTERMLGVIDARNVHRFKNRGQDTGKSPLEIYREETAIYPVTALSADVLEYIFLPITPATVRRSQVKIRHEFLQKTITYYHPELANCGGAEVTVRYNPFDVSHVWIFAAGKLLCMAEEWGMINPKNQNAVMEKIEKQNSLVKQIREKYAAMAPASAPIPRIHPQEREARQVRAASEVRVLKTSLEGDQEKQVAAGGRGYRPLVFAKKEEPVRLRPVFALEMDNPIDEE
ncbi:MAG: Mu transposase C-terminal domain-containing protein, partial [Pseudomonadota bacterium]